MTLLDPLLAEALGISREAPPPLVARALLRTAGVEVGESQITAAAARCLEGVAAELEPLLTSRGSSTQRPVSFAKECARISREAIVKLRGGDAPAVLALLAPNQHVPAGTAADLLRATRALTARHLPGTILRVLEVWADDGLVVDVDRQHPDDIEDW